jgi:hypothetical protein
MQAALPPTPAPAAQPNHASGVANGPIEIFDGKRLPAIASATWTSAVNHAFEPRSKS